MEWIAGRRNEIEMLVEIFGLVIFGMDHDSSDSCNISRLKSPQHRIFQQPSTNLLFLPVTVYRKPSKQHDRNGMF